MTQEVISMLHDDRPIASVWFHGPEESGYAMDGPYSSGNTITAIKAYPEPGQCANVPWIAVFKNNYLVSRFPAEQVTIVYREPQP